MAIKNKFPAVKPTLNLDFVNSRTIDPRVTFTRASTATYYDGKTVAKAEENLFTQSSTGNITSSSGAVDNGNGTWTLNANTQGLYKSSSVIIANGETFTVSAAFSGSGKVRLSALNGSGSQLGNFKDVLLTETPTRHFWTGVNNSAGPTTTILLRGAEDNSTAVVRMENMQLELRDHATPYTPTTDQPITRYQPVLMTAPANVPRIDYDPVTGECKGLLIEESRTNLFNQSEFATGLTGNVTGGSVSATTFTGFSAGMSLQSSTTGNTYLYKALPVTVGVAYTFSLFIRMDDGGAPIISNTNTVGDMTLILEGDIQGALTLVHLGGGLYRASGTRVSTGVVVGPNWGVIKYGGQSARGFKVTGYQVEAGAFPTSYIPTTTSQVTRASDNASMTGENFSSWYRQDEGTIHQDFAPLGVQRTDRASVALWGGSGTFYTNSHTIRIFDSDQTCATFASGAAQAQCGFPSSVVVGLFSRVAYAYKANDFAASKTGKTLVTGTSGVIPEGITTLSLPSQSCGHIKRIAYWPKRLPDATLQALTA